MNEKSLAVILEALADEIEELRAAKRVLEYQISKLNEALELYKAPLDNKKKAEEN